jgi:selenobiotic family peptide radical SAM maturase
LSQEEQSLYSSESSIRDLNHAEMKDIPAFMPDLVRLENAIENIRTGNYFLPREIREICINPTVRLLELSWKNLLPFLSRGKKETSDDPEPGKEIVVIWKDLRRQQVHYRAVSEADLLAMKIIEENIDPENAAEEGNVTVGFIDAILDNATREGILLSPSSQIARDPTIFSADEYVNNRLLTSESFTIQWHITQACDLHCRHCYDRSARSVMTLDQGVHILDGVRRFCRDRHVMKAVSFTGGNPFLYPHFFELYRAASERGFSISILGNPTAREKIEQLISIQKPSYFQVSLEGLQEQDDFIRGEGHFQRVIEFLKVLRELGIFSMVMLTLTKSNMKDIIPLAGILSEYADRFHFNRLSMVGEGANLVLPNKEEYRAFLESYGEAMRKYPVLGLKDNMLSILHYREGRELFGGCTTFGCGAAFNFLAVLSDGEVHACRKFPSPVGNLFRQSIAEIYDSPEAQRYRAGCRACHGCKIHPVCGGCLAVAYSLGRNVFEEKDPYCFIEE